MNRFLARWKHLPRAARWLITGGAFTLLYFLLVEPVVDLTNRLGTRADYLERSLARQGEPGATQSEIGRALAMGATNHGEPLVPGSEPAGGRLNERLEAILRDREVASLSIKARAPAPLGRGPLQDAIGEGKQVQRQILDLDFEATPDVAMQILAELEKAPEVAAVGRVIIRKSSKDGRNLLQVSVSPESWTVAMKGGLR